MSDIESVYVARQPVFKKNRTVWGYELLFRSSKDAQTANVEDDNLATYNVIADGLTLALPGIEKGRKALINFPESLLLSGAAFALPFETCVVEVLETVSPTPKVIEALGKLREFGFTLALDDFAGEEKLKPFLPHVDILKMDIMALDSDPDRIRAAVAGLPGPLKSRLILLAEKVEDKQTFDLCVELGFHLFQGFFFSRPEIIPGKKVSANEAAKLQILQELSQPDFELAKLSQIINTDPSLSYRLFRYVNSAGMGLTNKVESVTHATTILGQQRISQWLRAVILSDLNPTPTAQELSFLSLQRAKFLELACEIAGLGGRTPETLFTLGLFSLLDSLMGIPMKEILAELPLDDEVAAALMGKDNQLLSVLHLAEIYEQGDFDKMQHIAAQFDIDPDAMGSLYSEGMRWVLTVLDK